MAMYLDVHSSHVHRLVVAKRKKAAKASGLEMAGLPIPFRAAAHVHRKDSQQVNNK